jgi:hypothetical protein
MKSWILPDYAGQVGSSDYADRVGSSSAVILST